MPTDKAEKPRSGTPKRDRTMTGSKIKRGNERGADTFGFRSQIPWTEEETRHVKELLEYLTVSLSETEGLYILPPEETRQLLKSLQQFLMQDHLDRNDPLLSKIAYYFHDIQCVDLKKVANLMSLNKKVGDILQDQKVILLLGNASSGKTTTLHCLAGTAFKEVVVDGFVHLQPTQFLDASVAGYETSCSRVTVTKSLQTAKVKVLDEEYIVCDTPVLGCYDSIEEEIAHKEGLMEAISRARSIRPVFVLSQECLGNRMSGLPDVFDMIMNYFHLQDTNTEVIPFQYVFTRFDDRHRTRLWKMFKYYSETAGTYEGIDRELFEKVVDDMVEKTNPEANVVSPISDIPRYLLKTLLEDPALECNPREALKQPGQNEALNMLHIQLKLTLYGLLMFLACHDFEAAVERVKHLKSLAAVLPVAVSYYDLASKACERYAITLWESFNDRIEHQDYLSALANVHQSIQLATALPDMDDYILLSYEGFWRALVDQETKKSNRLMTVDTVLQLRDMAKLSPDVLAEVISGIRRIRSFIQKELVKIENVSEIAPHIMLLLQLGTGFPEAAKGASESLERLEVRIKDRVKERDYKKATDDLVGISKMYGAFPERTRFALYGVKSFKQVLEQAIDNNSFENAGEVLFYLTKMKDDYIAAGKYVTRGLEKMWTKFEYAIKQREYATAICIIKHLGKASHVSLDAFERSRLGIEVLRDRLFKSIENKQYGMAQVLMQQLTKLERMLPKDIAALVKAKKAAENEPPVRRQRSDQEPEQNHRRRTSKPAKSGYERGSSVGRKKKSSDQRQQEDHNEVEGQNDPDRRRRSRRVEVDDRRDGYDRRDDIEVSQSQEEEMSELTMSVVDFKRFKPPYALDAEKILPPPPVTQISMAYVKMADDERRDSPPRNGRHESPRHKSRRESPPLRKIRAYDPDSRNPIRFDPLPTQQRKGRSISRTRPDSPAPRKSRHHASSRRHRQQESQRKSRHESQPRKTRHPSPIKAQKRTSPRRRHLREAKEWFESYKGNKSRQYDDSEEYSVPAVAVAAADDDECEISSFENVKNQRNTGKKYDDYRRTSRHSRKSYDTGPAEENSMYRRERLRRVDPSNSCPSDESGTSWDI